MRLTAISLAALAAIALLAAAPAHAANGLIGLDAMTATVFQEGQSSFSGLAIRGRMHDSRLLDNVEFLPTVEYWRNSSSVSAFGFNAIRRDATIGADARWMFPGEGWRFYGGAGYAIHFISNEVTAPSIGHKNDSLTKGGLTLLGGVAFGTKSRFGNFIEAKGHMIGDFKQLKINMGLSWNK